MMFLEVMRLYQFLDAKGLMPATTAVVVGSVAIGVTLLAVYKRDK